MTIDRPNFIDSEWFDKENWELKPGAPEELVKEFEDFKAQQEEFSPFNLDL